MKLYAVTPWNVLFFIGIGFVVGYLAGYAGLLSGLKL